MLILSRPKVSFVVPVRNAERTLAVALNSLIAQRFDDFEILVYDDGSTDRSSRILSRFTRVDKRLKILGNERVGLVEALRRLAAGSNADLLARMDADDFSYPQRLAEQVSLLDSRPEIQLVGSLVHCFPTRLVTAGMRRYEQWLNDLVEPEEVARDIYVESPLCHPSVVMRKQAYSEAGGYLDDGCPEDYGLWLRFHDCGFQMAKVNQVLLNWREGDTRLTRVDSRYDLERFCELKLKHLKKGPLLGRTKVAICGAGKTGRRWSIELRKHNIEVAAFIDINPDKWGGRLHGVPVLRPTSLEKGIPAEVLLVAVAKHRIREQIRGYLVGLGYLETRDFICIG